MDHATATRKLHAIYRRLRKGEIRAKLDRSLGKCFGLITIKDELFEIYLNPQRPWRTRGGLVSTILHEMIHLTWWGMPEKDVEQLERDMFDALSDRQLTNLLKKAVQATFKGE